MSVRLNPSIASTGEIEEMSDIVTGWLDVSPFTFGGTAASFFDAYFEVTVDGLTMYTIAPTRYSGLIDSKPPPDLGVYTAAHEHLPLYDSNGVATGYYFAIGWHFVEHDYWESWPQRVEIITPDSTVVQANVDGSMEQDVFFESGEGDAVDDDSDNRDEVVTELVDLNLTGSSVLGPLSVRLNPSIASTGEIEEMSDIVTGWLDLPPFTFGGTAASFFDAFFEVMVDGLTMYTISPTRYSGLIDSKPPPDLGVFTAAHEHLPLYDSLGVATGYYFAIGWHDIPFVEHDHYESWPQLVEVIKPDSTVVQASVDGLMTQDVFFETAEGDAVDDDGDNKDEVVTELTDLDLTGNSVSGMINVRLNPTIASTGEIEETSDIVTGRLDVSPFTAGGTASSFFDAYFEVTVDGQTMYTIAPTRYSGVIDHKPASDLGVYTAAHEHLPLYDSLGVATGYSFAIGWHFVEHDHFESWPQRVEVIKPDSTVVQANVDGSMTQDVFFESGEGDAVDDDSDNRDEVATELTDLNLTGSSVLGPLSVRLNPSFASTGEIEETSDIVTGWLDVSPFTVGGTAASFFDAYFEVTVDGQTMYTTAPTRYSGVIDQKPPPDLGVYTAVHEHLPLYDSYGVATGYAFAIGEHPPEPVVEHDHWESWPQRVEIIMPDSTAMEPYVDGYVMQDVFFEGPLEGDANDDDGDNKDEVVTELVDLHLTGNSVLGPVSVRLNPSIASTGEIEEWSNSLTGRLDLPPFSASGAAMAFFDAYFEVTVGGQPMYTISPTRYSGLIYHKPPSDLDVYTAVHSHLPLYDSNGVA
ncbi:MAG: hypothetical protein ACYSUY_05045, partial [Planctomycetota bacterium]